MTNKSNSKNFIWKPMVSLALVLTMALTFTSCNDDDDDEVMLDNIVTIAQGNSNLSILVSALTKFPDLVSALQADGTYTVFAPNNAAFTALLGVIGQESLDDIPEPVLRRVLEYHVLASKVASTDLTDGQTAGTLLTGESIEVGVGSGVTINGANVVTANVEASNGIVHIVDAVLVPSLEASIVNTVVEPAYFNKDFSILTAAVVKADLVGTLINKDASFTVFAPTNEAFEAAGITSIDGLDADALTPILLYHVLGAEVTAADLPATGSAVTSLGGDFYLSINENGVFINGSTQVIATDISADNGVVHVVDRTLVPPTQNIVEVAIASTEAGTPEFTQLVAALVKVSNDPSGADLVATLSDPDGNFTVFAPTDVAFAALYEALDVTGVDEIDVATLQAVLTYHVVSGARILSTDLPNLTSGTVGTVNGGTFELDPTTATIDDNGSTSITDITATDILATNGVIHVIDKVILP
ncbi:MULTISPECIES: fasciclin domain-containing protein [unclassified Imperialibacter]|uniref:fasciclin domain-containing protein n=1 Tax=unclassified Imperialibacter TaxID=2629706 RepID=UPI00125A73D5|nr:MULTISPECIES: fasciclin domain-containing protein [unclassified Imperialibacter]CAD5276421.1 conserved exported hypothetical protein [Imperialibacter sp. 89]CAD5294841.1 conserved exported hypothetical protein [Imperialibacter sp. 75]VVT26785.1 Uncaracterized surface protein containing fasciclin (FAS1) repeats [Imperialibacter sp. EC-SDR9]